MGAEETKKVQDNESKADKFVRLGEYRVNKVIDAIGRLENLSNRTNYEYTQEQVEAMFSIMEKRLLEVKGRFAPKKGKRRYIFIWKKSRVGRKARMKQLEKEINVTSQRNMMKRYKMYGATVSKLTEKSQNDTKKGERK